MDELLINYGGAVKAVGGGRVQGYLVSFGDADHPDLTIHKDFYTKAESDFDLEPGEKRTVYFHHGLDDTMKTRKLGKVELSIDDVGVWADGVLNQRDKYEKAIYDLAAKGKLGWSSGATTHLVRRERIAGKNAHIVRHWPISEASLTPDPADYRNEVIAVKSADVCTLFAEILRDIEGADELRIEAKTEDQDLIPGESDVVTTLSALPIRAYLETMGAIVTDCNRRLAWYANSREVKQGRVISSDNLAAMQGIYGGMKEAHTAMEEHIASLEEMIKRHARPPHNPLAAEFARYLAIGAAGAGASVTL